jgi:hypothetical protein
LSSRKEKTPRMGIEVFAKVAKILPKGERRGMNG